MTMNSGRNRSSTGLMFKILTCQIWCFQGMGVGVVAGPGGGLGPQGVQQPGNNMFEHKCYK